MSSMTRSLRRCCLPAAALIVVLGCATPGSAPDDMSAVEHRDTAHERIKQAARHRELYDPNAIRTTPGGYYGRYGGFYDDYYGGFTYGYRDFYWSVEAYNPTLGHLTEAQTLERHAKDHLAAAKTLEQYEEGQCAAFPTQTRAACPLLGHIDAVDEVFGGVRLRFDESVNINAAVAHVRCHTAFARTRARVGMNSCPLYIPGIDVARVGERTIELTAGSLKGLEQLRRRSLQHLETTAPEVEGP